jgi:hypothetical protein
MSGVSFHLLPSLTILARKVGVVLPVSGVKPAIVLLFRAII